MFAARTAWNLSPNPLTLASEKRRAAGLPVIDLTESNPTRCGFVYPEAELVRGMARFDPASYAPHPRGTEAARAAIAADYASRGVEIAPEHLVLTSGTSEAYSFLFRLLTDPGDRILVPAPSYPLFEFLARINDVVLATYPLHSNLDFAVDIHALASAVSERTRAILLVNPGNPSGVYLKHHELDSLESICGERGIPLICDEVFGDYAFGEDLDRVGTLVGGTRPSWFVLNGLSKMLALPQLKLAWIALGGPESVVTEALRRLDVIADTHLSVGAQVQHALPDLFRLKPSIQQQIRERLSHNRSYLHREAGKTLNCRLWPAEGGWSAILRIPTTRTEESWALRLLERDGILTYPGYFFDFPDDGRLVISLLCEPARFRAGVDRLLSRVDSEATS